MSFYRVWSIAAVVLLLGIVQLMAACAGPSINEEQNTSPDTDGVAQASLDDILNSPNDFYGETVDTTGKVSEVLSPVMFEVGGATDEVFDDPDRNNRDPDGLTIVNNTSRSSAPEVAIGQTVRVTGPVRELDIEEIEADTGLNLSLSKYAKRSGTASLVAGTIEVTGGETTAR